jgi:hypothetical protein
MQLVGDDPTMAFIGGLPAIKKALKDATQRVKGLLTSMENELEDVKKYYIEAILGERQHYSNSYAETEEPHYKLSI